MISVKEAQQIIQSHKVNFGTKSAALADSMGRVLAEEIIADRAFPPFDRVTMDGIAICYENHTATQVYPVEHTVGAGSPLYSLQDPTMCVEVMTGCILPAGCDTVIRYEDLEKSARGFSILRLPPKGKNVHKKGSDHPQNNVLLAKGHVIRAPEINILATVGKTSVVVHNLPKIAIISSGDELVKVNEKPLTHQIRRSNSHMIQGAIQQHGIRSDLVHIADNKDEIITTLKKLQEEYDVFVLSGGVSMGKYDFIPAALEEIGITKRFHKVKQRPGKPFWFGTNETTTVFAFPGNPVSTLVGSYHYLLPWLASNNFLGLTQKPYVTLAETHIFNPALTLFLHCKIDHKPDGTTHATPLRSNGSGDLVSPAYSDGFIVLPADRSTFTKGEVFPFYNYNF